MSIRSSEWGPAALEIIAQKFVLAHGLKKGAVRKLMAKALSHKAKEAKARRGGAAGGTAGGG
jgi:hypothetical protein